MRVHGGKVRVADILRLRVTDPKTHRNYLADARRNRIRTADQGSVERLYLLALRLPCPSASRTHGERRRRAPGWRSAKTVRVHHCGQRLE
uniref:Uncharacterized protein n=1 Tax=Rhodococcus sp. NS1 TaxID=402236 RepID=A0A097SQ18_9NOCA|nr:hypothetical protein LRS1606.188 [Rhodococcus sp. NS1]